MSEQRSSLVSVVGIRREAKAGRMRERRELAQAGLTELAIEIGVSAPALSRWERGLARPTPEHAQKWDAVLREIEQQLS
ncbi:MAG: helix-turn-helix domain-containing protein [Acidimicrobiales bacterium]